MTPNMKTYVCKYLMIFCQCKKLMLAFAAADTYSDGLTSIDGECFEYGFFGTQLCFYALIFLFPKFYRGRLKFILELTHYAK